MVREMRSRKVSFAYIYNKVWTVSAGAVFFLVFLVLPDFFAGRWGGVAQVTASTVENVAVLDASGAAEVSEVAVSVSSERRRKSRIKPG